MFRGEAAYLMPGLHVLHVSYSVELETVGEPGLGVCKSLVPPPAPKVKGNTVTCKYFLTLFFIVIKAA